MTALATVHLASAALQQRARPVLDAYEHTLWHADNLSGFDPAQIDDDEAAALGRVTLALSAALTHLNAVLEGIRLKCAADYQVSPDVLDTVAQMKAWHRRTGGGL